MLLLIFFFYKQMEEPIFGSGDALNSLRGEMFSGKMTIFMFIQVSFIIFERYLFLMNPNQWTDWETFKKTKQEYGDPRFLLIRRIARGLEGKSNKEKLSIIFKRTAFLVSIFNINGKDFADLIKKSYEDQIKQDDEENKRIEDYIHNPLYKRLMYVRTLMFFFYFAMFVYFPLMGNKKLSGSYLCNSYFMPVQKEKCNYVSENIYIHLLFIMTTLYFILCALQIRFGESFLKNQKKKDRKWTTTEKITNAIVTKAPFIFEIKTALDFAVTKTSLGLFEWFKFEDIYNSFFTAKYLQISSDMKKLGAVRPFFEKIVFGWVALFIFLGIVLAPIFIFSSFNPDSTANEILSFETTVGIKIGLSKFILYTNNNPKSIYQMNEPDFNKSIGQYSSKLNYNDNKVAMVTLYPFGDSNWDITSDMYKGLEAMLLDTLSKQSAAYMFFGIKMSQKNGKITLFEKDTMIPPQVILTLNEVLGKCGNNKIQVPNYYYQVLKVNPTVGLEPYMFENINIFNKTVEMKPVCIASASTDQNTSKGVPTVAYWNVTNEPSSKRGLDEDGLTFYIIQDNYSKSLAMFSSVVAMYTGFVLIIGNVIRGVFTGQTNKIWTTDVPKAEQIIRICEGVTSARIEGNTLREEVLYWELIDIMRSPEMVKLITRNYLDHKKEIEKMHAKEEAASSNN